MDQIATPVPKAEGVRKMKRVINGKTCNTNTAAVAARWEYEDLKGHETNATLFQTKGGAFFVVHQWETSECWKTYFGELTHQDVNELVRQTDNLEIIDQTALSEPPEAA
jgi:hypothetical protein